MNTDSVQQLIDQNPEVTIKQLNETLEHSCQDISDFERHQTWNGTAWVGYYEVQHNNVTVIRNVVIFKELNFKIHLLVRTNSAPAIPCFSFFYSGYHIFPGHGPPGQAYLSLFTVWLLGAGPQLRHLHPDVSDLARPAAVDHPNESLV